VRLFTAHVRGREAPVLVPEGFSGGALVFGPLWFAVKGAWVAAAGFLLFWVLLIALAHGPVRAPLGLLLAVTAGLFGQDLRRTALEWRGYVMAYVIAGRTEDAAYGRLIDERPYLIGGIL
jgi:hypothetical protein